MCSVANLADLTISMYHRFMISEWTFKKKVKLPGNDNLAKLIQFYVWETPVPDVSSKGVELSEYGWKKSSLLTLHAEMRKISNFPGSKNQWWISVTTNEIEKELQRIGRLDNYDCSFEFAVHTVRDGLNKTEALFYLIRNSFAHGGFRKHKYEGEIYYAFENQNNGMLKGRAIFREQTLLNWIKVIKKGPANGKR